jgi:hypothetical protein
MRTARQRAGAGFIERLRIVYSPFTRGPYPWRQRARVCAVALALFAEARRLPETAGCKGRGSKQPDTRPRI